MFDALDADQRIGDLFDLGTLALHDQHLKTMVVIQVHVHPGQDKSLKIMLNGGEFFRQVADVMIIDKRDGPDRLFILRPFLSDQLVPDQIPERLRAVGVFSSFDMAVEIIKQMMVERDAEPDEFLHIR